MELNRVMMNNLRTQKEAKMFRLDPQLERDTFFLYDLTFSRLLLKNDRNLPWLILVPRKSHVEEIIHLSDEESIVLMEEIREVSRFLNHHMQPYKINIATLGNIVRQLHVHIMARLKNDRAFPEPIWSVKPGEQNSYLEEEVKEFQELVQQWFAH